MCLWEFILLANIHTTHTICIRKCQGERDTIFGWFQTSEYAAEIPPAGPVSSMLFYAMLVLYPMLCYAMLVLHPLNKAAAAPAFGLK